MFPKDILIIDFEATGNDPWHDKPTQLGAILLDKNSLQEKSSFSSFIKADLTGVDPKILAISGITQDQLNSAPSVTEVARQFHQKFGYDVLLSSWVEYLDRRFLERMMDEAGIPFLQKGFVAGDFKYYNYHYLDLWPLAYVHLVQRGYKGSFRRAEIFKAFGIDIDQYHGHDALEDCRMEAEILRKIVLASQS